VVGLLLENQTVLAVNTVEAVGFQFAEEKVVEGKTLTLNGVAVREASGLIKVYAVGLYLVVVFIRLHPGVHNGAVQVSVQALSIDSAG
jgi:hypothetical protein